MSVAELPAPAPPADDPLAPVRRALLSAARRDAAVTVSAADTEAGRILAEARATAEAIRAEARSQGEADGRGVVAAERVRVRRQARAVVLRVQGEAYATVRQEVHRSVAALREDPGYPAARERLANQARSALGPDATVTESPEGGVVARAGGRRAVLTLTTLADRVLDSVAPDLEGLWAP